MQQAIPGCRCALLSCLARQVTDQLGAARVDNHVVNARVAGNAPGCLSASAFQPAIRQVRLTNERATQSDKIQLARRTISSSRSMFLLRPPGSRESLSAAFLRSAKSSFCFSGGACAVRFRARDCRNPSSAFGRSGNPMPPLISCRQAGSPEVSSGERQGSVKVTPL